MLILYPCALAPHVPLRGALQSPYDDFLSVTMSSCALRTHLDSHTGRSGFPVNVIGPLARHCFAER